LRVLDLFCGAGGLSSGFKKCGFSVTGVDSSELAGQTFSKNGYGQFLPLDLSKELAKGSYDIVVGGPPCKPWSNVNLTKRGEYHSDYGLLSVFFKHIDRIKPKCFLLENVPPLQNDETLQQCLTRMRLHGYSIEADVFRYSDYGAATSRRRLFIFGILKEEAEKFSEVLSGKLQPASTVKDKIWQLRKKEMGDDVDHVWPKLKTISKYSKYYSSGKYGWRILEWDKPAPSFGNVMKTYILHPDSSNGGPKRVISVKEASLIMGFPSDFSFAEGCGIGVRYQMIVDAVSPVFSIAVAETIKGIFENGKSR
jgi:DNA (cytosine-5)-methyltransferase 1